MSCYPSWICLSYSDFVICSKQLAYRSSDQLFVKIITYSVEQCNIQLQKHSQITNPFHTIHDFFHQTGSPAANKLSSAASIKFFPKNGDNRRPIQYISNHTTTNGTYQERNNKEERPNWRANKILGKRIR